MNNAIINPRPAGTYRFEVRSVEEALAVLKSQLGPRARVLSVRQARQSGWKRYLSGERLEVIAELPKADDLRDAIPAFTAVRAQKESHSDLVGQKYDAVLSLRSTLINAGFSERLLLDLEAHGTWVPPSGGMKAGDVEAFADALGRLVRPFSPIKSGPIAFYSDCNSDKHLAISQWLSGEVFAGGTPRRVCHLELRRPNPFLELEVLCLAIGAEFVHYNSASDFNDSGRVKLWDLPCTGDPEEVSEIGKILTANSVANVVFVQNAAYELECMLSNLRVARNLGATHLVLTHLNRVRNVAKLWDIVIASDLSPLFFSFEDHLLTPIEGNPIDRLISLTLGRN